MLDSDEKDLKDKDVDLNQKPDRAVWLDSLLYMSCSLGVGCLLFLLIAFAIVSATSSPSFETTPVQNFIIVVFILFAGAAEGPYSGAVVKTDYMFLQFFVLPVLLILLFAAGYKYRKAGWGKILGALGVCLWLLVGSGLY